MVWLNGNGSCREKSTSGLARLSGPAGVHARGFSLNAERAENAESNAEWTPFFVLAAHFGYYQAR